MKSINFNNASIIISAGRIDQIPAQIQIAVSGRSNVGKSTLINKLCGRLKLARTSSEPGKTITINVYDIDSRFHLIDLPGYGYARRSESEKRKWSALVEGYFAKRENLLHVIQLVDLKVGPTKDDEMMLSFMQGAGLPYTVVSTKADKLNKTDKAAKIKALEENIYIKNRAPLIVYSSRTGEGIDELRARIEEVLSV